MGWFSTGAAGSILGAGLGAIGSVAGGLIQQNQNKKMMREQMRWNTSEREASQNFTRSERLAQQGYQTAERNAQNDWSEMMYQNYQSPQALRAQYSAAGLDPALAISGNAAPAASSGSSGGAPTGAGAPTMGITPPYQNMNSFSQGFGQIADALASLAQAKKAGVETDFYEKTFASRVNQVLKNEVLQDLEIDAKALGNKNAQKAFEKLEVEIQKEHMNLDVIEKQLDILDKEGAIKGYEKETWKERFKNEQDNLKADTQLKENSAWLADQQGISEFVRRDLMQSESNLKKALSRVAGLNADTLEIDKEIMNSTKETQKEALNKAAKEVDAHIDLLNEQAALAKKNGDYFVYNMIMQSIATYAGLATQIYSARTGRRIEGKMRDNSVTPTIAPIGF